MFKLNCPGEKCQRVRKLRRMQSGAGVTGHRPVIRVNDGFEEAHDLGNDKKLYQIRLYIYLFKLKVVSH